MAAPQNNQGQTSTPKQSYNFCLSVHSFSVQQVALAASFAASLLTLGHVCLTCSQKMLDRSLSTPLPGMQHKTRQHRCPPLPMDCHPWLEPLVPQRLMGKSLLPTSLGANCQDKAAIPRPSGMHACSRPCSVLSVLPVPPSIPSTSASPRLPAPRRPPRSPSMKLAVGTAGRETPPPPL